MKSEMYFTKSFLLRRSRKEDFQKERMVFTAWIVITTSITKHSLTLFITSEKKMIAFKFLVLKKQLIQYEN